MDRGRSSPRVPTSSFPKGPPRNYRNARIRLRASPVGSTLRIATSLRGQEEGMHNPPRRRLAAAFTLRPVEVQGRSDGVPRRQPPQCDGQPLGGIAEPRQVPRDVSFRELAEAVPLDPVDDRPPHPVADSAIHEPAGAAAVRRKYAQSRMAASTADRDTGGIGSRSSLAGCGPGTSTRPPSWSGFTSRPSAARPASGWSTPASAGSSTRWTSASRSWPASSSAPPLGQYELETPEQLLGLLVR